MKLILAALAAVTLFAQTPQYPGAVATDSHLKVRKNFLSTSLAASISAADTLITVRDASRLEANMLLTIDHEVVNVTAVSGNSLTVERGFDNTTAASHRSGAAVVQYPTAWDINAVKEEIKAIQSTLGANLQNVVSENAHRLSTAFDWSQTPGGSIAVGVNLITLTPCPNGVAGANSGHQLYISGGTGTAEVVTISGGSCTSGAASGTIAFTAANTHSGAWTIGSATEGIAEGLYVSRAGDKAGVIVPVGTHTVTGGVTLAAGDSISCINAGAEDRWRSNVHPCKILYTGTGDLFTATSQSNTGLSSLVFRGLTLATTTGRYAIYLDGTLGAVFGVLLEGVTICDTACQDYNAQGWTNAIKATGAVFDVTVHRCTLVDNRGDLININPDHGELGGGNQWSIVNSFLIPTANGTWAIKAVGTNQGYVLGTIHVLHSTIAEAAPTGANGIWVNGGLKVFNSLVEGNGAKAGTVGIRATGTTGGMLIGNDILTWGKNVQIGDPTNKTWVASGFKVNSRILAPGTTDVEIVDGGSRLGTEVACMYGPCDIDNLRETVDGEYRETTYNNPETSYTKDYRGLGLLAGSMMLHQKTSGQYSSFLVRNAPGQDSAPDQIPLLTLDSSGNLLFYANVNGSIRVKPIAFASLPSSGTLANPGTIVPCSDCTPASNPCTGGGSASDGVLAVRSGAGTWVCK